MDETIEMMNDEVPEEPIDPPENIEEAVDLRSELESLRQRLETAERTAREISAGWREFSELYPDADISSLPDSFNADIERGTVNMRIETILRICDVLHITPDEILTEDEPHKTMQQDEIWQRLEACSPKDKETALKILSVYLQSLD